MVLNKTYRRWLYKNAKTTLIRKEVLGGGGVTLKRSKTKLNI